MEKSSAYQVGGSISATTSVYIQRQADTELYQALSSGELCYVFNSRQMGKSSLLVNVKSLLQQEGYRCCFIDLSRIGSVNVTTEQWYAGIISELWRGFELPTGKAMLQWWQSLGDITAAQKLAIFFQQPLLESYPDQPLAVFFDEVDSVLSLPFAADDFFSVIRACYNLRVDDTRLQQLRFSFFGVALPSELVADKSRSPFNIGQAIELEGFTTEEAQPLADGFSSIRFDNQQLLDAILYWSGGQPFLTQKICQLVTQHADTAHGDNAARWIDELVQQQIIDNWESQDNPEHLRTIYNRILLDEQYSTVNLASYEQLLDAENESLSVDQVNDYRRLYLSGLIAVNKGLITPRTRVYRRVFDQQWLNNQLDAQRPYAKLIRLWLDDNEEHNLLRGQDLSAAKEWANHRRLPETDHRFIAASQALESREFQQWNQRLQTEIEQRQKAELAAEQANQAKTDFLARVSHEVRTPINSVLGLSYLAQQHEMSDINRDYLQKIHRSTSYMLGVINDIVDINRIERGEMELHQETFRIDDSLDKVIEIIAARIFDKKLDFQLHMPHKLLPPIIGDSNRLEQLLLNLCANAINHTEAGGITIDIEQQPSNTENRLRLQFCVQDSGSGVAERPLQGVISKGKDSVLSPGLGLSLCCELVQLMQGELRIDSRPEQGSSLYFSAEFPLASQQAIEKTDPADTLNIASLGIEDKTILMTQISGLGHKMQSLDNQSALTSLDCLLLGELNPQQQTLVLQSLEACPQIRVLSLSKAGSPQAPWLTALNHYQPLEQPCSLYSLSQQIKARRDQTLDDSDMLPPQSFNQEIKILLAEDDEINQQIVSELLQQAGLNIDIVANGKAAVNAVQKQSYDLVLMDIEMPIMGGVEAVQTIRALNSSKHKAMPIIAMTGHALLDDKQKFLAAGMNDYITKPLEPALLWKTLQHWLPNSEEPILTADKTDSDQLPLTISGIDTKNGLLRCGGNNAVYLKLLQQFARRYQNGIAFDGHDASTLASLFHTIKGSAANLGLMEISTKAAEIERLYRQGNNDNNDNNKLSQFSQTLQQQCAQIQQQPELNATLSSAQQSPKNAPQEKVNKPDKARLLVVDDQADNIRILKEILKDRFQIIAATNGKKALQLALADPQPVAILQDIEMPDMNGFEICQALKANKQTADIPVIFVSANVDEENYQRGFAAGGEDFITKPVSPALLFRRLHRCLT
ncbi:MAG: response regulator [Pseudomonadales bacterium]|nr:response regulator [Pseudomonadales bacterium]